MPAKKRAKPRRRKQAKPRRKLTHRDQDMRKGAFEAEAPGAKSQSSMRGQLPHTIRDEMLKDSDSDRSG